MTDRETVNGRTDRAASPTSAGRDTPLPPPVVGGESILASMQEDARVTTEQGAQPFRSDQRHDEQRHLDGLTSSNPLAISVPSDDGPTLSGDAGLGGGRARIGDKVFLGLSSGAAALVTVIVVLIAVFLVLKSVPSIAADKDNFLTSTEFTTSNGELHFGIAALLWVTVIISVIALLLAVPVAIGIALFITQYAPARLAKPVAYIMDLLAAIPSIVYGIWGYTTLSPKLEPVQRGLSHIPIPLFNNIHPNGTIFDGAIVLAVMVLPIITAISRDVFERTPRANVEAALALGATKWEMIRIAVIPYGRPGVVSGAMLGLGRALGETIAVYLILSTVGGAFHPSLFTGGSTFASQIAGGSNEFNNAKSTGAYIAAGLVLFVLTFLVNAAARTIVNRRKDFS
jgi:phosphate transport system permease protein